MENNLSICAVIVSYEPDNLLIRLYDSVKEQVNEILIVDNNSQTADSKKILQSLADNKDTTIIYNDKNYGIAKALNQGVRYALQKHYKWILTLDQDSEFYQNTYNILLAGYETLKNKDKVMLLAPKPVEKILIKEDAVATWLNIQNPQNINWKNATLNLTSGSLIKSEVFARIGFFEEKLFIEQVDNDFCYRLLKNGYKTAIADNIQFIHRIGNAEKKLFFILRNHAPQRKYYLARNSVYMLKKYFRYAPYVTARCLLGATILGWIKILLFENNKLNKIKKGFKGLIDGVFNKY